MLIINYSYPLRSLTGCRPTEKSVSVADPNAAGGAGNPVHRSARETRNHQPPSGLRSGSSVRVLVVVLMKSYICENKRY